MSNITLPGTGSVVATDAISTLNYEYVKLVFGPDGTASKVDTAGNPLPTSNADRAVIVATSTTTRPADTNAYAGGDLVANSTTAASVVALSAAVSDLNDAPVLIESIVIDASDPLLGAQGVTFRLYLYNSNPASSTGIQGGDNTALSIKKAGFVATFVGAFIPFFDGSMAICVPEYGARVVTTPATGGKTLYTLQQILVAFTPVASTTFVHTLRGTQGRV